MTEVPTSLQGRVKLRNDANDAMDSDGEANRPEASSRRIKGRGARETNQDAEYSQRYGGRSGQFESLRATDAPGAPQKSKEGYILIITGLGEETQEDDIHEKFQEFGDILNTHLNLDRRTGYVKGYAFVEYASLDETQKAKEALDGSQVLGATIAVDFAFKSPPSRRVSSGVRRMSPPPRRRGRDDMADDEPNRSKKR